MPTYGRQVITTTGIPVMALANLDDAFWKPGGITLDWATVTAVVADTTLADGTVIPAGQKGIEFGTILCDIGIAEVETLTITATSGTYSLTGNGIVSAAIAFNATSAIVQGVVRSLGGAYANALVTGAAGGPYTITFERGQGDVTNLVGTSIDLAGGAATAVVTTGTAGAGTGKYGPYDSAVSDGRQTLARGHCFILNETILQTGAQGLASLATDNPAVFSGGLVWKARLKIGSVNPVYLGAGNQPTVAAFETAFPRISYAIP
jgi:hypothetical protein